MQRQYLAGVATLMAVTAAAANPETLTEQSQEKARAVLDRTVEAMGGLQTVRSTEAIRIRLVGDTWPRLQMTTPTAPFEPGKQDEKLLLDFKNGTMVLDLRTSVSGFTGHGTVVLQSSGGTNYDHEARTATAIPAAQSSSQQFTQYYRRLPNLILLQALNAPNSLRHLGQESFDGRSHDVITFVMPDTQQVSLFVDAKSSLISKYEIIFVDSLFGEDVTEVLYGDYVAAGAHRVPRTFMIRQAGEVAAKLAVEVEINPPEAARVPPAMGEGYAKVAAPPASVPAAVEKLAEGVYSIQNVAGQNQNTLAVAFADHILAVEAPGSSAGSEAVIAKIKEVIPGKPIRYLAMTHHHGDHIGGVRGYIAEGAQIVTTRGNTELVRTMAQARQNDRLSKEPRAAEVTVVEKGRRVFSDSTQTVELIDIGPTPHAREMLIAYLPKHRIVFQGDLFAIPAGEGPVGPPQAGTLHFARQLEALKLDVDRITSVHGRTATIEEFRRAVQTAT